MNDDPGNLESALAGLEERLAASPAVLTLLEYATDLEIRGAGELLGSRLHGHISALGFDLYCQLLERAVRELLRDPVPPRRPPSLHLGSDVKVPDSWLGDAGDRPQGDLGDPEGLEAEFRSELGGVVVVRSRVVDAPVDGPLAGQGLGAGRRGQPDDDDPGRRPCSVPIHWDPPLKSGGV